MATGPAPRLFLTGVGPILAALSGILVATLRVCLIASVFAHCVERTEDQLKPAPVAASDDVLDYPDPHNQSQLAPPGSVRDIQPDRDPVAIHDLDGGGLCLLGQNEREL